MKKTLTFLGILCVCSMALAVQPNNIISNESSLSDSERATIYMKPGEVLNLGDTTVVCGGQSEAVSLYEGIFFKYAGSSNACRQHTVMNAYYKGGYLSSFTLLFQGGCSGSANFRCSGNVCYSQNVNNETVTIHNRTRYTVRTPYGSSFITASYSFNR